MVTYLNMGKPTRFPIAIFAHRGYSCSYPENTLLAFSKAIEAHADFIELDVHRTKDDQLVVFHDPITRRLSTIDLPLQTSSYAELQQITFAHDQKIPLLREVLTLCKGKIGVLIELKHEGLVRDVCSLVTSLDMEKEVAIFSFYHSDLAKISAITPLIPYGTSEPLWVETDGQRILENNPNLTDLSLFGKNLWIDGPIKNQHTPYLAELYVQRASEIHSAAIFPIEYDITPHFVSLAHNAGLKLNVWIKTDDPATWDRLINLGVDGILTNNCQGLYNFLEARYAS